MPEPSLDELRENVEVVRSAIESLIAPLTDKAELIATMVLLQTFEGCVADLAVVEVNLMNADIERGIPSRA